MNQQDKEKEKTVGMFLTYCKKTLLNARTDVLRRRNRRMKHEVPFCELPPHELDRIATAPDIPPGERLFNAYGYPIGVADGELADALADLTDEECAIVLLSYYAGWSDRLIGENMGCPRSTVQSRRARALSRLAEILVERGRALDEEDD